MARLYHCTAWAEDANSQSLFSMLTRWTPNTRLCKLLAHEAPVASLLRLGGDAGRHMKQRAERVERSKKRAPNDGRTRSHNPRLHAPIASIRSMSSVSSVKLMSNFFAPPQSKRVPTVGDEPANKAVDAIADTPTIVLAEEPEKVANATVAVAPPVSAPAPEQVWFEVRFPPRKVFGLTDSSLPEQLVPKCTKADQAREAWAAIEKPVTEASFVRWYCANHNLKSAKRAAEPGVGAGAAGAAPPAKKAATQARLPGASAPPAAAAGSGAAGGASSLPKAKRSALVKGLLTSLKAAAKAKRWHRGDDETLTCSVVMDAADFSSLKSGEGVALPASSGVVTAFVLTGPKLAAMMGSGLEAVKVPCWSHPRAFCKSMKAGDATLSFAGAEGKYSRGTSTLTLKCAAHAPGGYDDEDGMYGMW